jgi:hypothetical protein
MLLGMFAYGPKAKLRQTPTLLYFQCSSVLDKLVFTITDELSCPTFRREAERRPPILVSNPCKRDHSEYRQHFARGNAE